ncbi:hypothetical protein LXL04_023515 [Taraxacum kok-saghyz]
MQETLTGGKEETAAGDYLAVAGAQKNRERRLPVGAGRKKRGEKLTGSPLAVRAHEREESGAGSSPAGRARQTFARKQRGRGRTFCCLLDVSEKRKKEASLPVFIFGNQAGLDMLETNLVALQDITLDKMFDDACRKALFPEFDAGRKALFPEFGKIMQQGVEFQSSKTRKKMVVGFVTFENTQQGKTCGNKTLKTAEFIPRSFDKNVMPKMVTNISEYSNDVEDGDSLKDSSTLGSLVSKGRSAREVVIPLAHISYTYKTMPVKPIPMVDTATNVMDTTTNVHFLYRENQQLDFI